MVFIFFESARMLEILKMICHCWLSESYELNGKFAILSATRITVLDWIAARAQDRAMQDMSKYRFSQPHCFSRLVRVDWYTGWALSSVAEHALPKRQKLASHSY